MWQRLDEKVNRSIDKISDGLAKKPGLLPLLGLAFIALNFFLQILPGKGYWIVDANPFLHIGLIIAILGLLLIRPLS